MSLSADATEVVPTAQARALTTLREWVLSGELKGGERIAELPLVERLGMSRTPVRAALQRLAQEGLLQSLPHGGYVVRQFTRGDIEDAIALRGVLEGTAARWAAERGASTSQQAQASALLDALDEVLRVETWGEAQWLSYGRSNAEFHDLLLDMADSEPLRLALQRLSSLPFAGPSSFVLGQAVSPAVRQRFVIAQDQHRQVLAAVAARQGSRAEALMREHAHIALRNLEESLAARGSAQANAPVARLLANAQI
jgi:GntR family transcriptional regulator of vanillate catabolism